jgi:F-type H+-transporting ATPase subunit epsilon
MSSYKKEFNCEVLTPAGRAMSAKSVSVVLPLADGQLGILADHAPLVAMMGAGAMTAQGSDGKVDTFFVSGGFAYMRGDQLSVLAEESAPAGELDAAKVSAELEQARKLPADTPSAGKRRSEAIAVALAKLRVVQGRG